MAGLSEDAGIDAVLLLSGDVYAAEDQGFWRAR